MAEREASRPTLAELAERLRREEPIALDEPVAETLRRMRDADEW